MCKTPHPPSPLAVWREERLEGIHAGRGPADYGQERADVTVLLYYWAKNPLEVDFRPFECALRETWLQCGMLPTTIVANEPFPFLRQFAETFAPFVRIDLAPELVPGDLSTMSADMNGHLAEHFDTPWVLVVQEDGFPLRRGLDEFVGKWDFIGAPYVRDKWWTRAAASLLGCWVSNGGFSLRSKAICECAAALVRDGKSHGSPRRGYETAEDVFYTRTLPLSSRCRFRIADTRSALTFSWDDIVPIPKPINLPFGFHRTSSFISLKTSTQIIDSSTRKSKL